MSAETLPLSGSPVAAPEGSALPEAQPDDLPAFGGKIVELFAAK